MWKQSEISIHDQCMGVCYICFVVVTNFIRGCFINWVVSYSLLLFPLLVFSFHNRIFYYLPLVSLEDTHPFSQVCTSMF